MLKRYLLVFFTLFLFSSLINLPSNSIVNAQESTPSLNFDRNYAYGHVVEQLDLGYRIPGTSASRACADYFIGHFQELGPQFKPSTHEFTIHSTTCQNILVKLNTNETNILILGAHYDSRAKATKDSHAPNSPVPGANDGASGCAVLLELATAIYGRSSNLACQIWFLFIDAEDQGKDYDYGMIGWSWCEGSTQFVNGIQSYYNESKETFDAMILLDMVGGNNLEFIREGYSTQSLLDELFTVGRSLGYTSQFPSNPTSKAITDDHLAFLNYGIPSADLIINFWSNPNWPYHHTTEDIIDHISKSSLEATGKTVEQYIYNNYYSESTNPSPDGNSSDEDPGNIHQDFPYMDFVIFFIMVGVIIGLTLISINLIHKRIVKKSKEASKPKRNSESQ